MDSLGLVIFKNGDSASFGIPVYMDDPDYLNIPGHEECFKKEILPLRNFKQEEYTFDQEEHFYSNVRKLSREGLIIILNNKSYSKDQEKTLGFVPSKLTSEQKETLKDMLEMKEFDGYIQELYEFIEDSEPIKYDSLEEYYKSKKVRTR